MDLRHLFSKFRHLFTRREQFDAALQTEFELHMEERTSELIAEGMRPEDARLQAKREFGSTTILAEDSQASWRWTWIEDLRRDLAYGARALRRDRGFALAAILSLALGIGVNASIFSLTAEYLFSLPSVRDSHNLLQVAVGGNASPMSDYRFLRNANLVEGLAGGAEMQEVNWRVDDTSWRLFATRVTGNYFSVMGVPVGMGRGIQNDERNTAVVSQKFWRSRLNSDPAVLGRVLTLDGVPYTIVGVLPEVHRTPMGFGYSPDMYLPFPDEIRGAVGLYARIPDGMTKPIAFEKFRSAAAELDRVEPDPDRKRATRVFVSELTGADRLREGFLPMFAGFFALLIGVSTLLLLIACGNVAGLLLARGTARATEFAIRMGIGAGRGRLIRQLLAESLLLSILGTGAGLLLSYGITRLFHQISMPVPFPVQLNIEPDTRLLAYAAAVSIVACLIAGLFPAIRTTRLQVSGRRTPVRNILVASQLAVSVLLLILAALSVRNLIQSTSLDPGFDIRQTVWAQARLVPSSYPDADQVRALATPTLDRLRALSGVKSASIVTFVPLNDHFSRRIFTFFVDGKADGVKIDHSWNAISPDYLKTMDIGLIAGRDFHPLDRKGSQRVAILNEALAFQLFGNGVNPVGHRIRFNNEDRVVVGIARNSKYSTLGEDRRPAMYEPYFQAGGRTIMQFLVRSEGPPETVLKAVNAALLEMDPAAAVEIKPMHQAMAFALFPSRVGAALLGAIGSLGLFLAAVGLYGVLAYSINRRVREIGLRMALGAEKRDVLRLVLGEGASILVSGLAIGMFLAVLVPGIRPMDPLTYMAVTGILICVGLAACITPALRALRIDPMIALRYE
jgi:predicted permease